MTREQFDAINAAHAACHEKGSRLVNALDDDARAELDVVLAQMRDAARGYYADARAIEYHQFLELAGLMNEIIKICARMAESGKDFRVQPLAPLAHEIAYIGEKLGCIFGPAFDAEPRLAHVLAGAMRSKDR